MPCAPGGTVPHPPGSWPQPGPGKAARRAQIQKIGMPRGRRWGLACMLHRGCGRRPQLCRRRPGALRSAGHACLRGPCRTGGKPCFPPKDGAEAKLPAALPGLYCTAFRPALQAAAACFSAALPAARANHNLMLNVGFAERPYKGHYSSRSERCAMGSASRTWR